MDDADLHYKFICPTCSGNFSVQLARIPPVQARFRCPHCKEPMDFPSREEARASMSRPAERSRVPPPPPPPPAAPASTLVLPLPGDPTEKPASREGSFRVDKTGFESDVFDRRGVRNLIRTGELQETDPVRVDDSLPIRAGELPYLKPLFSLAQTQKSRPPLCCRTHTDKTAFFRCQDTGRPLCDACAAVKTFGAQTLRVCRHCGGAALDFEPA